MFKQISTLLLLQVLALSLVFASTKNSLQLATKKYRSAGLVEMNVEKLVKSELLGKETKHQGKIYLANGKFRWENNTPEKSLLVFDGKTIWSVQTPPPEFGGPDQVATGAVDKKTKSHILISSLLGADIEKSFKLKELKSTDDLVTYEAVPKQSDLSVKNIQIIVEPKTSQIQQISYTDDIGNLTTLKFTNVKFNKKAKNSLFKYKPSKDAQVSEL